MKESKWIFLGAKVIISTDREPFRAIAGAVDRLCGWSESRYLK